MRLTGEGLLEALPYAESEIFIIFSRMNAQALLPHGCFDNGAVHK